MVLLGVLIGIALAPASADDCPTYRHDVRRSGISGESLTAPLSEDWVFVPTLPPSHAWGDPQPVPIEKNLELPRMRFDDAFHVAAAGRLVYFGSSADNTVYALDARDGQVRWTFTTDGPVRLAPTVAGGKVYVGSDDDNVYRLGAAGGRFLPHRIILGAQAFSSHLSFLTPFRVAAIAQPTPGPSGRLGRCQR